VADIYGILGGGMSVAERLRDALGGRSIRWLSQELGGRGLRGSSYDSVHGYVTGKRSPPVEVLEAAADALGVAFTWLATGAGTRVRVSDEAWGRVVGGEVDQEARRKRMASFSGKEISARIGTPKVSGDAPGEAAFVGGDPLLLALDQRHRLALLEMAREGLAIRNVPPSTADLRAAGKVIAAALRVPAELTGTGAPTETLDAWHLARYVEAFLAAARLGIPRIQAGAKHGGKGGRVGRD